MDTFAQFNIEGNKLIDILAEIFKHTLTRKQLEVYILTHPEFGGLSMAETGELLGVTKQTILRRLLTIRKKFPHAFNRNGKPKCIPKDIICSYKNLHDKYIKQKF